MEKNPKRYRKTGSKTSPKSYVKLAKIAPFYRVQKYSCLGSKPRSDDLSVDRPIDRPTVIFTVGVVGRPHLGLDLSVDRSVDRGKIQRAKLSGRSTEASPKSERSGSVDRPVDRPSSQGWCTFLCTSVDQFLARSTSRSTARRLDQGY